MPGSDPFSIGGAGGKDDDYSDAGIDSSMGSGMSSGTGIGDGSLSLDPREDGNASVTLQVEGDRVGVSAVDETNTLLVRTTTRAWKSIRDVVERLDVMPMQVHIEAQIAEVTLTGDLRYRVNWYFERAVTDAGLPTAVGRPTWTTLAGSVLGTGGSPWTFLGRNTAAVIGAPEEVHDVQIMQQPSVLLRNTTAAT